MSATRKLRAILTMGVVSGLFWGTASVLGFAGYQLLMHGTVGFSVGLFVPTMLVGFIGGVLYASALALLPTRDEARELSPWRSALIGAFGGIVMMSLILLIVVSPIVSGHVLGNFVIPLAVFGLLGAGTGVAIAGTAKRGALPKDDAPPEDRRLTP